MIAGGCHRPADLRRGGPALTRRVTGYAQTPEQMMQVGVVAVAEEGFGSFVTTAVST